MKNRTEHWVSIKKGLDKLLSVAFFFCIIVIVWLLFQVIGFVSFKIPSDSMEPALFAGDNIGTVVKRIKLYNELIANAI